MDAPEQDVAKLLRRGLIAPADGQEVPAEVAAAVAVLDAEAEARRPRAPPAQSTRERLSTLLYRAGATGGEFHAELLGALTELIDERIAAADGRSADGD